MIAFQIIKIYKIIHGVSKIIMWLYKPIPYNLHVKFIYAKFLSGLRLLINKCRNDHLDPTCRKLKQQDRTYSHSLNSTNLSSASLLLCPIPNIPK